MNEKLREHLSLNCSREHKVNWYLVAPDPRNEQRVGAGLSEVNRV